MVKYHIPLNSTTVLFEKWFSIRADGAIIAKNTIFDDSRYIYIYIHSYLIIIGAKD